MGKKVKLRVFDFPVIYIDPQKARKLDQIIAKQTSTINIDP